MLDLDYLQNLVKEERVKNAFLEVKCRRQFLKKLIEAIENKNKKRVSDYLNFLYSRLLRFNEFYARSLHDIFIENEKLIDIDINIYIGTGDKSFTSYTMDLSHKYIDINSDYRS